jgi:hypothetical protein
VLPLQRQQAATNTPGAMLIKTLFNKNVRIFPNDTYPKKAKILDMEPAGVLFEITDADVKSGYAAGDIVFIAYAAGLVFKVIK